VHVYIFSVHACSLFCLPLLASGRASFRQALRVRFLEHESNFHPNVEWGVLLRIPGQILGKIQKTTFFTNKNSSDGPIEFQ
jgi:hypothetical protein